MKLLTATLNGKHIAYSDQTEFLIQVGKGDKGAYRTKYRITGNLGQAVGYFNGINVGLGWKKRLLVPSFNKPLLARVTS